MLHPSGRAGRRSLDSRGIVIQMLDERMESTSSKRIVKGETEPILSTFPLGYNMVLNLMRTDMSKPTRVCSRAAR